MHLDVDIPPTSTFYIWLNLEKLPAPLNNGLVSSSGHWLLYQHQLPAAQTFFEELLKEKTIIIPGIFFDINPAHRRNLFNSPCHTFIRISFGPPLADLDMGAELPLPLFCRRADAVPSRLGRVRARAQEGPEGRHEGIRPQVSLSELCLK
jgi:hypothetical protein